MTRTRVVGLLLLLVFAAPPLAAQFEISREVRKPRLFETSLLPDARGQLLDESGARSKDQMFGAGVALGFAGDPIGFGLAGWFDYYLTTWLAVGARFQADYGIVTRRHENGGTALDFGLQFGAKIVFDVDDWEFSRWLRPYVALYPAGFRYHAATERAKDSAGRTFEIEYGDIFYVITTGGGVDFFLTSNIALGAGIYVEGTVGGSKHKKRGVSVRHRGGFDFFFEYARVAVRF